ncbi:unnamed protein product [Cylicostephanus goldi]|uniref:Uncharacterized protein n=1 Tax=Cylicostephanus goldi TaxID=71465 RepID=A0A3P6RU48_CYLGO|nr:unnamed protein product [Cylicostephanus goldi]
MSNGNSAVKKLEKQAFPAPASVAQRRHSAMVGSTAEQNNGRKYLYYYKFFRKFSIMHVPSFRGKKWV